MWNDFLIKCDKLIADVKQTNVEWDGGENWENIHSGLIDFLDYIYTDNSDCGFTILDINYKRVVYKSRNYYGKNQIFYVVFVKLFDGEKTFVDHEIFMVDGDDGEIMWGDDIQEKLFDDIM